MVKESIVKAKEQRLEQTLALRTKAGVLSINSADKIILVFVGEQRKTPTFRMLYTDRKETNPPTMIHSDVVAGAEWMSRRLNNGYPLRTRYINNL